MRKRWLFISNSILLIAIFILFILLRPNELSGNIADYTAGTNNDTNRYFEDDALIHQILHGNLFDIVLGEYVISEQVAVRSRARGSDGLISDISGTSIYMSLEEIIIDGVTISERPFYTIIISESNLSMHNSFIPTSPLIDIPFDLFISVEIRYNPSINVAYLNTNIIKDFQFYVKDIDTIYLIYDNVLYRAKRNES